MDEPVIASTTGEQLSPVYSIGIPPPMPSVVAPTEPAPPEVYIDPAKNPGHPDFVGPRFSTTATLTPAERLAITKIIHSFAGKFCERFPFLVFDDVVQEGWRVFYTYTDSHYDKTKGCTITTWFYRGLNWELISYAEREYKKTQHWDELQDQHLESLEVDASTDFEYRDTVEVLKKFISPLCAQMLDITLREPKTAATVLCDVLSVNEKDLHFLRDELKYASRFVL